MHISYVFYVFILYIHCIYIIYVSYVCALYILCMYLLYVLYIYLVCINLWPVDTDGRIGAGIPACMCHFIPANPLNVLGFMRGAGTYRASTPIDT